MSTYTDLHHRIKDNITVLRRPGHPDDGMTPQLVKLMNPENEYYGTFKGKAQVETGTLNNVEINGAYIHNAELSNVYLNGIKVDNIAQDIINLSAGLTSTQEYLNEVVEKNAECHHKIFTTLCGEISVTNKNVNFLSGQLDELSTNLSTTISCLSDSISADVKILSSSISAEIEQLSNELSGEISSLHQNTCESIDVVVQQHNNDVDNIYDRITKDYEFLLNNDNVLNKKIENEIANEAAIRAQEDINVFKSSTGFSELNKHYSFTHHPSFVRAYDMHEYSINSIKTSAPLALLVDDTGYPVGKITEINLNNGCCDDEHDCCDMTIDKPISELNIEFFNDLQGNFKRLIDDRKCIYQLTSKNPIINIGTNYLLIWTNSATCTSLDQIDLAFRTRKELLTWDIYDGNKKAGFAYYIQKSGDYTNNITSCEIQFVTGDHVVLSSTTTYDFNHHLKFELSGRDLLIYKHYKQLHSQILSSQLHSIDNEFGFIPEFGIHRDNDNQISSIEACIYRVGKNADRVCMLSDDVMSNRIDVKCTNQVVAYDGETSCVNLYDKQRIFVYQNKKVDTSYLPTVTLSVGSNDDKEYNKTIFDDCNNMYVRIDMQCAPNVLKLEKHGNIFVYHNDELGIDIQYNSLTLRIHIAEKFNGIFAIDPRPYAIEDYDKLIAQSYPITDEFLHIDEFYKCIDKLHINHKHNPCNVDEHIMVNHNANKNVLNIRMPNPIPGKSREFILNINLYRSKIPAVKLNLIGPCDAAHHCHYIFEYLGEPIREIYAPTGRTTTIKFQEISPDKFVISDVDDSFLAHKINNLEHDVDRVKDKHEHDINVIYSTIKTISTDLSAEIGDLSSKLSTDIDNLSTRLSNDIIALSTALSNDIVVLSDSLSTTISSLSNLVSAEISTIQDDIKTAFDELNQKNSLKGAVWLYDHTDNSGNPTGCVKTDHLSTLIKTFNVPSVQDDYILSNGWMFNVREGDHNAIHRFVVDNVELENGDYLVIKTTSLNGICVKDITSSDVYVIDAIDSYGKFESISVDSMTSVFFNDDGSNLNSTITTISNHIDNVELSTSQISNYIDTQMTANYQFDNRSDSKLSVITQLSVEGGRYDVKSRELVSSDVNQLEELVDDKISPVDSRLATVSNDLNDLSTTTFANYDIADSCGHIHSRNLIITNTDHADVDKELHQQYYMTFELGTLVLKPISNN